MQIGEVIRKYRKAQGLTQEEVAHYLGVTTPAVNKWENGNAMPDIMMLAPISRLLKVSLNELLSFQEMLTVQEVKELTKQLDQKLESEEYAGVFEWAKAQIEQYPNCEQLRYSFSTILDANRMVRDVSNKQKYDDFLLGCYERLLKSDEEEMRTAAADALYGYYLRKEQFEKAERYLSFFSMQNPERKRKQAQLYQKTGDLDKAYQTYEEILFSGYQMLSCVLNSLYMMEMSRGDREKAHFYTEKRKELVRLFEMGDYNVYAADLELVQLEKNIDKTIACVEGLLEHTDTLYDFTKSPLYSHMTFREIKPGVIEKIRKGILEGLRTDEVFFSYMKDDPRWDKIVSEE